MSARALAAVRAALPLSLSLSLVGCSLAYCGDDAFSRSLELRHGEIAGTALLPGPTEKPAAFVQASVRGTPFVRRTNSEGRFVFSGLAEGPWLVTVSEDADGDGKAERRRIVSTVLRAVPHRTSPSYVPFVGGGGETALNGVDVGEVLLEGTVSVSGRVLLDGGAGGVPPLQRGQVAVVVAGRNLDLPRLDDEEASDLVSLGAEVKTGVDDEGRFVLRNVSGGDFYLLVLVYEQGPSPGQPGPLRQVSAPIPVSSSGDDVVLADDIVLEDQPAVPRRDAQLVFSPPPPSSEQVYLTFVPPGLPMPSCEDAPIDYSPTPYPYALTTSQISAGGTPTFTDVPVGVWDIQACFTRSPYGTLFAQTVAPRTPDETAVLLGPVLLSSLPSCVPNRPCVEDDSECGEGLTCDEDLGRCVGPPDWKDCDGDGARGLPEIGNDADRRALWASCVSACFEGAGNAAADTTCDAADGDTYDCDDDGDGQPDVTEAQACYGVGRGTDSDGDGVCDGVDPFPECRANTAVDCEAGAPPDVPAVPQEYADEQVPGGMCAVERAAVDGEGGTWCDAVAVEGAAQCVVTSMTCSFTPEDRGEGPPAPRCDVETGRGCPLNMECQLALGNGSGVAPCADRNTTGCESVCEAPGFVCRDAVIDSESVVACVSDVGDGPDIYGLYVCQCCDEGGCERSVDGSRNVWMPDLCHVDEMQDLWAACHGGSVDPLPPPDAGPDGDDAGVRLDAGAGDGGTDPGPDGEECATVLSLSELEQAVTNGSICIDILTEDRVLPIANESALSVLSFGNVRTLTGSLLIQNNPGLLRIDAPALEEVQNGAVTIDNNPFLTQLDIPNLQLINGDLNIWRNPSLNVASAVPPELVVDGTPRISANACSGPTDCILGTPVGATNCGFLSGLGDANVCYGCLDSSWCDEGAGETCDIDYTGSGTGTYTCTSTDGAAPVP